MDPMTIMAIAGPAISSMRDGVLGSLFGTSSAHQSFKNQKALLKEQFGLARRQAKEGPSWQVEGLRRAGLNPVMTALGGASFGGASIGSAPSTAQARLERFGNGNDSMIDGIKKLAETRYVKETAKKVKNENNLLKAQEDKIRAETETIRKTQPNKEFGNQLSKWWLSLGMPDWANGAADFTMDQVERFGPPLGALWLYDKFKGPKDPKGPKGPKGGPPMQYQKPTVSPVSTSPTPNPSDLFLPRVDWSGKSLRKINAPLFEFAKKLEIKSVPRTPSGWEKFRHDTNRDINRALRNIKKHPESLTPLLLMLLLKNPAGFPGMAR